VKGEEGAAGGQEWRLVETTIGRNVGMVADRDRANGWGQVLGGRAGLHMVEGWSLHVSCVAIHVAACMHIMQGCMLCQPALTPSLHVPPSSYSLLAPRYEVSRHTLFFRDPGAMDLYRRHVSTILNRVNAYTGRLTSTQHGMQSSCM
jgi:hypothetical protein